MLLPVLVAAGFFAEARMRHLLATWHLVLAAFFFVMATGWGIALNQNGVIELNPIRWEEDFMVANAAAWALVPFAWVPLAVQWQRHR